MEFWERVVGVEHLHDEREEQRLGGDARDQQLGGNVAVGGGEISADSLPVERIFVALFIECNCRKTSFLLRVLNMQKCCVGT